jgi:hypothetical protein
MPIQQTISKLYSPGRLVSFLTLSIIAVVGLCRTAYSAQNPTDAPPISIDSPRALSEAVLMLVQKFGYVITYEDARLSYVDDLQDLTTQRHANLDFLKKSGSAREIVPIAETLQFNLPVLGTAVAPDGMATLLKRILANHAANKQGAHFELRQRGSVFHVVPTEVRNASGTWISAPSVLDTPITTPKTEGPLPLLLQEFCHRVRAVNRASIVLGQIPMNALAGRQVALDAKSESARDLLLELLNATGQRLTWLLDYDAATQQYYLGIVQVPNQAGSEAGSAALQIPTPTGGGMTSVSPPQ